MTKKISAKSGLVITAILVPYKGPIDKVAAMYTIQGHAKHQKVEIKDISFYKENEGSEEMLRRWEAAGMYGVDIGDRKYHGKAGSATEYVVKDLDIPMTKGLEELVGLINLNNKSGMLKGQPFSVAHLMREFYEFSDDTAWHLEIISAVAHVVEHFVTSFDEQEHLRKQVPMPPELKELADRLVQSGDKPFTIGRYLTDMWVLGAPVEEIMRRINWWLDNRQKNKTLIEAGKAAWDLLDFDKRTFMAGNVTGIVVESDNRYLVRVAVKSKKYQLRLIKRSDGHMTISTAGLDMEETAAYLMAREPGRWFYQPTMQAIINGGPQYVNIKPTDISTSEMVSILQDFAQPRDRRRKYGKTPQAAHRDHGRHGRQDRTPRSDGRARGEAKYYS